MKKNSEITLGRFLRIILILITLGILYFIVDGLSGVLLPFCVAWLIAYLLYPLVRFFQYRLHFKYRLLSIVAALTVVVAAVIGAFMLVVPSMMSEFAVFKGALEGRATQITEEMKLAAALALANLVPADELNEDNILPEAFNPKVAEAVAEAVKSHIK